ncbi:MAG: aminodeoxychorismate lyase [Acidobacteria bacterium]|nr:aminodeoxychorismate lyase [Acidobacteriota bacterium]
MWIQLNDQLVPEAQAVVSVLDRGFLYGDGVFETMRAYRRRVFRLDAHLERLAASATALSMRLPRTASQIGDDVQRVLDRNDLDDAVVRITVSRGRGRRGPGIAGADTPTYVMVAEPLPVDLPARYTHGVRLGVARIRRVPGDALPASAKHTNYLNSILAVEEVSRAGADDAVLLNADQHVTECATANIFCVRQAGVWTPPPSAGILSGVTRALVLELARHAGLHIEESLFGIDALLDADEVFVTNSVIGLCPVRSVDAKAYLVPGPVSERLVALYAAQVRADTGGTHAPAG